MTDKTRDMEFKPGDRVRIRPDAEGWGTKWSGRTGRIVDTKPPPSLADLLHVHLDSPLRVLFEGKVVAVHTSTWARPTDLERV